MKQRLQIMYSIILAVILTANFGITVIASENSVLDNAVSDTAEYIYKSVANPQIGSIGGEWSIIGLARSSEEIPKEYYESYYDNVVSYIKSCGGILDERKYTEYSRVILALTAIGKSTDDIGGYNLLSFLGDYKKVTGQGLNGSVWALIALDSGNYEIPPSNGADTQATREMYINHILSYQLDNGGWSLSGNEADPDITAMALQALSKYQDNETVRQATEKALLYISQQQNENGGFSSGGSENSESCAQMITALCELGISLDDTRFVKNGKTLLDNLLTYYNKGSGFCHTHDEEVQNLMTTEQCFYGLVAQQRFLESKTTLYNMSDAVSVIQASAQTSGLSGKNPDVKKLAVIFPDRTFLDIADNKSRDAIEVLASRDIINGKSEDAFEPDAPMTRAEFAVIIVRGLGLEDKGEAVFADVTEQDWFFEYINTAYTYGIVSGVSDTEFNPYGTITREEAAVMVTRAAKLCGINTDMEVFGARDILAGFLDYVKASDWAVTSLAFCYDKGILSDEVMEIKPKEAILRAEIAQMLFNTLDTAMLL